MSLFFFENPLFLPFLSHGVVSPTLTCFTLVRTPFEGWLFYLFLSVRLIRLAILSIFALLGSFLAFSTLLLLFFFSICSIGCIVAVLICSKLTKSCFSIDEFYYFRQTWLSLYKTEMFNSPLLTSARIWFTFYPSNETCKGERGIYKVKNDVGWNRKEC
jgi:hypothetical protein